MSDYRTDLLERLKSARYSARYLTACIADSPEAFLVALKDVADAQKGMSKLATEAGVNRENLYRMLSEQGNPRFENLRSVLQALNIRVIFEPLRPQAGPSGPFPAAQGRS